MEICTYWPNTYFSTFTSIARHISFYNPWKFSRNLIILLCQFLAEMYKQENLWKIFKEWCCGSLFTKRTLYWHYLFWLNKPLGNGKKLMESFFIEWSTKKIFYQSFFEKYFSPFIPWKTTVRKYPTISMPPGLPWLFSNIKSSVKHK